jgi:hypothetical protein
MRSSQEIREARLLRHEEGRAEREQDRADEPKRRSSAGSGQSPYTSTLR